MQTILHRGYTYEVLEVLSHEKAYTSYFEPLTQKLDNKLIVKDDHRTRYTKSNSTLSKGCESCKAGRWLCLFPGLKCNAKCKFCPSEREIIEKLEEDPNKIGRYTLDEIKEQIKRGKHIEGVSYSGGEPFMYLDKIQEIATFTKENRQEIYQWIYTNGILVTEEKLKRIKAWGIQEVRVDLAATGFNEEIIAKLSMIKKIIGKVTVEIPCLRETYTKLIDEGYIHRLISSGVEQLNLAELYLVTPLSMKTYGVHETLYTYAHDQGELGIHPVYSKELIYAVMAYVIDNNLDLLVNCCSAEAKYLQREQANK